MFQLEPSVSQTLNKLRAAAPTWVVGGYLRDAFCGAEPADVDIATEAPIEEVKKMFRNFYATEKGMDFGVGRFSAAKINFEVSCYAKDGFAAALGHRDFTLNSMYHDGEQLFDPFDAKGDIKRKTIASLHEPAIHFNENPQAYLRAIRLAAALGFSLDQKLFEFLRENKHRFLANNESRIQQEGHKILNAAFPLVGFRLLSELGFIQCDLPFDALESFPKLSDYLILKILLIIERVGEQAMDQFIDLFSLSKKYKEKLFYLLPYLRSDGIPANPYALNEVLLLKKHQYRNDPEKLKAYFNKIKNK